MSDSYLKNVIEAALLAAARPVSVAELAQIFDEQSRPTPKQLRTALEQLAADYEGRGVAIKETANEQEFYDAIEGIVRDVLRRYPDMSTAMLFYALGRAAGRLEATHKLGNKDRDA